MPNKEEYEVKNDKDIYHKIIEEIKAQTEMCNTVLKPLVSEISREMNDNISDADEIAAKEKYVWPYLYRILENRYGISLKTISSTLSPINGDYIPRKLHIASNCLCIPVLVDIARNWLSNIKRKKKAQLTKPKPVLGNK